MKLKLRTVLVFICIAVVLLAVTILFGFLPPYIEKSRNRVTDIQSQDNISEETQSFHKTLFIADLHADSLLWNRDLSKRSSYGHVDVPRLIEGNIGLQLFSVVTKTPKRLNLQRNTDETDNITLLAIAQRWPYRTWFSLFERAIYQSEKLQRITTVLPNEFFIIKFKQDLQNYLDHRRTNSNITAGLLSLEGAHAFENDINNVDRLFTSGFRIIGFTHFFDNQLGGSAHGINQYGITEFGKAVLKRMNELGMLVDLAHASPALMNDVFTFSKRPVLVTHTGIQAICPSHRNLSDKHMQQVAKSGGVIGIGFWSTASCTKDIGGIVKSIQYAVNLIGEDHVALGSDFDGNVQVPFTSDDMVILTNALINANFTESQIKKIMGENIIRLLQQHLPNKLD